jgi:hypothetical protein
MVETKLTGKSLEERLRDRTKNSGDVAHADHVVTGDKGIRTNIHRTRVQQYGENHPGEGDIFNRPRGVANPKGQIP